MLGRKDECRTERRHVQDAGDNYENGFHGQESALGSIVVIALMVVKWLVERETTR